MWPFIVYYYISLVLLREPVASHFVPIEEVEETTSAILPDIDTSSSEDDAVSDNPSCPPEKSLHSKEDIKSLIDYQSNSLAIYDNIKHHFYYDAVLVSEKHINDFKQFKIWFQDRPEHLKHVLEDLNEKRLEIEPKVKNTARVLEECPQLQESLSKKTEKLNKMQKKFLEYKLMCDTFCEMTPLESRPMNKHSDIAQERYVCSSLADLHRDIHSDLIEFGRQVISEMTDRITKDDRIYEDKIEKLKNELKDVALKQFGRTMYDILNLQDDYHHFYEDIIMKLNVKSKLYKINERGLDIDSKLLVLEHVINKYAGVCKTCSISINALSTPVKFEKKIEEDNVNTSKDVVKILLEDKHSEIRNLVDNDYSIIFEDLNSLLNYTNTMDLYSIDLKPIQEDVTKELQKQKAYFNALRSIIPPSAIHQLLDLELESEEIIRNIEGLIVEVKKLISDHF